MGEVANKCYDKCADEAESKTYYDIPTSAVNGGFEGVSECVIQVYDDAGIKACDHQ